MKRFVEGSILLTVLLALLLALPAMANAATSGTCGDNLTWTLDDEGLLTISGTGEMKDYKYYYSSTLGEGVTNTPWGVAVKEVVIEKGVTSIGAHAFRACRSLSSISIPDGVTSIGECAFVWCSSLSSISIPDSVTSIGDDAFNYSSATLFANRNSCAAIILTKVDTSYSFVDPSYPELSLKAYENENGTRSFTVTECTRNAVSVTWPAGVTSIDPGAFYGCSSLSSISIPEGVTRIYGETFYGCSSLSSISIPESVTAIYVNAFSGCSSLSSITLPDNITIVGTGIITNCPAVLYVKRDTTTARTFLSASYICTDPVAGMFGSCGDNLTWLLDDQGVLTISGTGEMWDYNGFRYDGMLDDLVNSIPWRVGAKKAVVENGVSSIGVSAFSSCSSLSSIILPNSVTSIGDSAFYSCSSLSSIIIPEGVTSIGGGTFYGCSSLSSIIIPEGVTSIGLRAFYNCSNLNSISLPDSVTSIGNWAFLGCSSLSSIRLPEGMTSIGESAFDGCSSLSSISIPDGVISIGNWAFSSCSNLTRITLPDGITSVGHEFIDNCPAVLCVHRNSTTSLTLMKAGYAFDYLNFGPCGDNLAWTLNDEGVLKVSGTGVMWNYSKIKDSTLGRYVTTAPWGGEVKAVVVENGVSSIGVSAFYGCSSLSSSILPNSVTSIGDSAFYGCSNLSSISIPNSVTSIGDSTFYGCSNLSSISIPEGVTSIEGDTFFRCDDLTSVYIPDSVTSIASDAFSYPYPTIYCYEYSYAETWGLQNVYDVVLLDGKDYDELLTVTLPETMSLTLGEAKPIAYDIFPQLPDMTIVWASSDEDVVTVADGVLTPVGGGSAVVTLTVNGVSASCTVTVVVPATRLALPEDIYVTAKTTSALPLTIEPAGATCQLVYTTGDSVYALISTDGVVTAGAVGSTTVSVTDQLTGLNASATIRICRPASQVSFAEASCTAHPGEVLQLTVNVTSGSQSLINALVTFASSDEAIAAVDQNGCLTAKAPGTVTITATASNGVSDSCTVTVKELVRSVLPAGLTSLDSEALTGVAAEWIVLPEGMQTIGSRAFAGCGSLVRVEIPASVTSIADDAFADCGALTIVAPEGSTAHTFAVGHEFNWTDK